MNGRHGLSRGSVSLGIALLSVSLLLSTVTVRAFLNDRGTPASSSVPATPSLAADWQQGGGLAPVPTAEVTPSPSATPPAVTPATPINLAAPLSARGAVLVDAASGTVLYEQQADEPLPPASTAKIVTALTVMRHARPEEVVTIVADDVVDPALESSMGLQAGDTVTVHDLLVGLLLPSGNDAARALARFVGERLPEPPDAAPSERFVAEMNAVAEHLGMTSSRFIDPAGDDVDGQVTTARDLAQAAQALISSRTLLSIVAMPQAEVRIGGPQARSVLLTNTNELLREEYVYGIKTGTTPKAGECLVVAYRGRGADEIAVIPGSSARYADGRLLLGLLPAATPQP